MAEGPLPPDYLAIQAGMFDPGAPVHEADLHEYAPLEETPPSGEAALNLPVNFAETVPDPPEKGLIKILTHSGKEVVLKQFCWDLIKPDCTVAIEGKRRAGKTNLVRNMLKAVRRYYPEVYVFTGTKMSDEYKGLVPDRYIFDNFETLPPDDDNFPGGMDVFLMLWYRQKRRVSDLRRRKVNDRNISILIIIEDLVANEQSNRGFHDIPILNKIAFNGRHAFMGIWVTSQNIKAIPPAIKDNTDIIAILTATSRRTKETVRESFVDSLENDKEFDEVFQPLKEIPWSVMFIDRKNARREPLECLYLGVPEEIEPDFVMGAKYFWAEDFATLWKNGYRHLVEMDDWGIEKTTYKIMPSRTGQAKPKGKSS